MSVCTMLLLTLVAVPVSILVLYWFHKALSAFAARYRAQGLPLPVGARYAPGLAVAVMVIAIAAGIGQGWRTSHPCGEASAAAAGKLPQVVACLAR